MRNHVRFQSSRFVQDAPEPGQVNATRHGGRLTAWLREQLIPHGAVVAEPIAEDWGWLLTGTYMDEPFRICCGNIDGAAAEWLVWVEAAPRGLLSRLWRRGHGVASMQAVGKIARLIDAALRAESSVTAIEWFRVGARQEELDPSNGPSP